MKKLFTLILSLLILSPTFAANGPAGCGLGTILFKDKEGLGFNILASFFNMSSGNQSFAMSTGTLGCESAKDATVTGPVFIKMNREKLANDIARGQGETLEAYLKLINKKKADKLVLKNNFSTLFAADSDEDSIHNQIIQLL
jgi:hypothetical protein